MLKNILRSLIREKAREFQREFKKGNIHVLSCSTTFELGVDLGDLDTIFLRAVPPEAFNYAQRVGEGQGGEAGILDLPSHIAGVPLMTSITFPNRSVC
ncbi:MAG: hypothetical protein RQM89_11270 [Acetomicrobium sp.]